ncbi:hypothetical protein GJ496_007310 [Pomphorhynchus laevis]|nr:hypothetical protein GJ496_007310 [Pomphorhynchus laevis]
MDSVYNRAIPVERAEYLAYQSITDIWFSNIGMTINRAYTEVISWSSNVYHLPKYNASKDFVNSRLRVCTPFALQIQKTTRFNSATIRNNITRRLAFWKEGKLRESIQEAKFFSA